MSCLELRASLAQCFLGCRPVDAGVGDRNAVAKLRTFGEGRVASFEVGFDHCADDGAVAFDDLVDDVAEHQGLARGVFAGVAVGAVDHDGARELGALELLLGEGDGDGVVVGRGAAAKNDVGVLVALGVGERAAAFGVDAEEGVRAGD